jgi:hypothetical protein
MLLSFSPRFSSRSCSLKAFIDLFIFIRAATFIFVVCSVKTMRLNAFVALNASIEEEIEFRVSKRIFQDFKFSNKPAITHRETFFAFMSLLAISSIVTNTSTNAIVFNFREEKRRTLTRRRFCGCWQWPSVWSTRCPWHRRLIFVHAVAFRVVDHFD